MARNKPNAANKAQDRTTKKAPERASKKPRTNFFTKDLWWMVDLTMKPVPTQGATPLVLRCMGEYDWSADQARSVLAGYKQFLHLKTKHQDWNDSILSPSSDIDKMWRMHILDTHNYTADCLQLCKGFWLHYNPDGEKDVNARKKRLGRTKQLLLDSIASTEINQQVWKEVWQEEVLTVVKQPPSAKEEPPAAAAVAQLDHHAMKEDDEYEYDDSPITIGIRDETAQDTFFKLKRNDRMEKVFDAFVKTRNDDDSDILFSLDGAIVSLSDTPTTLQLVDGDTIYVLSREFP
jgi:small ubiquitin-related modifier